MKHISSILIILLICLVTACSQGVSGGTTEGSCNKYGCASILIDGPAEALKPVKIRIDVKSAQSTKELWFSISAIGVEDITFSKLPNEATLDHFDKSSFGWVINAEANEEYIFEGTMVLPEPKYKTGVFVHRFYLVLNYPGSEPIMLLAKIYLDGSGKQLDADTVNILLETEQFLPYETGIIIFPTETPYPTYPIPTLTPISTNTPTQAPYP